MSRFIGGYAFKKGMILIISLWALSMLSVFSLYIGYGARQKIIFLKRISERDGFYYILEAAAKKAILEISKDDTLTTDSFKEELLGGGAFKDIKIGLGKFTISYDYAQNGETEKIFAVIDEGRKLNLNTAGLKMIQRLFINILCITETEAQALAASVIDFRDKDSSLSIPSGSAEDAYYANLKNPYNCKDADYELMEGLLLVKGMNQIFFDEIKKFATIYGEGKVNINTASWQVLSALGIDDAILDMIIAYRRGEDDIERTIDDNIFNLPGSITAQLSQYYSLSPDEVACLSNLVSAGHLGTNSGYFKIEVQAELDYCSRVMRLESVIDRNGKILYWQEI